MSSTDRSNTERIRQLKCRVLAASIVKGTYKTNDGETWLDIKIGREGRIINPAGSGPAIEIAGCCNCSPVCDMSGHIFGALNSYTGPSDILLLQEDINSYIIGTVTIPLPPPGYPNDYFVLVRYFNGCNISDSNTTLYDKLGNIVDTTQYYLGTFPPNPTYGPYSSYTSVGFNILYPNSVFNYTTDTSGITLTYGNACSSITDPVNLGIPPG